MSHLSFGEVRLFDDKDTDGDVLRNIVDGEHDSTQESFCILDVFDLINKHLKWISKMPKVIPHYAIKCNSDPTVIKILAAMNAGFDCASEEEIRLVMKHGVPGDRIIFANPTKWPLQIKFARKVNVEKMTVDSDVEIFKINTLFPQAKIVIRIRCDAADAAVSLGSKFGCDPDDEAVRLIHLTKSLGLTLWGFSFHVGSPCKELNAYGRGIALCKRLITVARAIGCNEAQLIDIGGGFYGDRGSSIDKVADIVNDAIKDIDPSIKIISEPGQYYVTSAFTLASCIHTKKLVPKDREMTRMYYMSCGVYNMFIEELLNYKSRLPVPLCKPTSDEKFISVVWGPTCDSLDCIVKDVLLPECHVGDWLVWRDMGSYSICLNSTFNGFSAPKIYPFARKTQWKNFLSYVKALHNSERPINWSNRVENGLCDSS